MTDRTPDLDALAEQFGFPKPVSTAFQPRLAAQIDLGETFAERETCCCALHGTLHDRRTCCPVHRQTRAGIDVPAMTPERAEAPAYDTSMDPCSPDFDPSSWA
ncbi:MAG: hypothetical protein HOV97_05455 [Nonomuraea sp.]|nr:hypothetical protein [Nonomuraea sp.]